MINIIGAGLAGLSAALTLAKQNRTCRLISLQSSERAQSNLAEGGINAALDLMGENDSPAEHFEDTMKGGVFLADPEAVKGLTEEAPDLVRELASFGVPFSMKEDRMIQRNFGGQKKKRTAFAKSSTGKAVMTALIDAVRQYEDRMIFRCPHHRFMKLILEEGRCTGVQVMDEYKKEILLFDGPVILANGGPNGLFPGKTTGTTANDGSVLAKVFSQGVRLANLEFIQYHPTTVSISGKRLLISEAARGEGGRLFIRRGPGNWYFMEDKYPELGNLMPRDVISREEIRVVREPDCSGPVCLDLTGLSAETWKKKLPDMRTEIRHYLDLDPARQPVPVSPGIHFFMGGILVDRYHRTNVKELYAAGECACQYHGANRLGGNSMLGAVYGGKKAAETALQETKELSGKAQVVTDVITAAAASEPLKKELCDVLFESLGVFRDEKGLKEGLAQTAVLKERYLTDADQERIRLGEAFLISALERRESRGAHQRTDHPGRDDERYRKNTVAFWDGSRIRTVFETIGAQQEET